MGKKHKRIKQETLISYLMIAPEMILMLIFIFIPIVYAFYISLFDWNAMGTKTFVGISNYLKMMQDLTFKKQSAGYWKICFDICSDCLCSFSCGSSFCKLDQKQ